MPSSRRILLLLAGVTAACALGAPAALAGAPADGRGVVLSAGGHTVRLVDDAHRVDGVRVRSSRGLRRGDVVRVRRGSARVTGHRRRVAFLGRVVRGSGRGAVVRLGDGSTFKLPGARAPHGRRARSAGRATVDLRSLPPGQVLLITIATGKRGEAVVTIKLLPAGTRIGEGDGGKPGEDGDGGCADASASEADDACGGDPGAEDEWADEVDGTVTALADDGSWLTIAVDDAGAEETYDVDDPSLLDGIAVGDEVVVYLDEDGIAIDVELLDFSEEDLGDGDDDEDA
jgi:hypothetical protein